MRARPERRPRAAPAAAADAREAGGEPLRLTSALAAGGRVARAEGLAGGGEVVYELRLPGIGGRYLAGIAAHAHRRGWAPVEAIALLDAVEERAAMWVVSPSPAALRRAGLLHGRRVGRRGCARWSAGRWAWAAVDVKALAAVAHAGARRGVCVAAVSGAGAPARVVEPLRASGARMGSLPGGLAASIGARWTVELLVAPALPAGSMMALRERIASAPRCGWCGVPILGADCLRCVPGRRA